MKKNNISIQKINIKNVNIEIFKGLNENGNPIIQKLKPVQTLKKRSINFNGMSFDKIQKAVLIIQNEKKRLNNSEYFENFDKKLMHLRENLNDRRENYKWYYCFLKFMLNKFNLNDSIN